MLYVLSVLSLAAPAPKVNTLGGGDTGRAPDWSVIPHGAAYWMVRAAARVIPPLRTPPTALVPCPVRAGPPRDGRRRPQAQGLGEVALQEQL